MKKNVNNQEIKIGDVFFISTSGLNTWTYNEDSSFFCSCGSLTDDFEDMLLVVKYIGDGILEEMLTGEKILVDRFYDGNISYEQDSSVTCFAYANYFEEKKTNKKVRDVSDYINVLKSIKENSTKYPLVFSLIDSEIYEISDENKSRYLEFSDLLRKQRLVSLKLIALKKTDTLIQQLDYFIDNFNIDDELTGNFMLDEAYFENKLFDFKKKKLVK